MKICAIYNTDGVMELNVTPLGPTSGNQYPVDQKALDRIFRRLEGIGFSGRFYRTTKKAAVFNDSTRISLFGVA